jgi:hypothetical protein
VTQRRKKSQRRRTRVKTPVFRVLAPSRDLEETDFRTLCERRRLDGAHEDPMSTAALVRQARHGTPPSATVPLRASVAGTAL